MTAITITTGEGYQTIIACDRHAAELPITSSAEDAIRRTADDADDDLRCEFCN